MRRPLILHPVSLTALVLLLLNDHVLKGLAPGAVTGKLSDFAGLALLPILVVSTIELLAHTTLSCRTLWAISSVVALGFVFVEATPLGAGLYEQGLGIAQLPFRYALSGADVAAPVRHVADIGDLIALPAAFVVCLVSLRSKTMAREGVSPPRST